MQRLQYLDFDLDIGLGSGREYPMSVRSPAGEARATMHFPLVGLALKNRLLELENALLRSGGRRRALSVEEQTVQEFGRALFEALLTDEIRDLYETNLGQARREDKRLRLKLHIQPPELTVLPWEFLYDPRRRDFVCLSDTPIVRYPDVPFPIQPLTVSAPLRILGMVASPDHPKLRQLDVENEKQRVEEAIRGLQANGQVELTWLAGQTWRDLQRAMRRGPWHIFHFIGHGGFDATTREGLIALSDDENRPYYLSSVSLGRLLDGHPSLKLVLLNSCDGARGSDSDIFSSTAANLVNKGIPAVLAMQYEITDKAAIEFARSFYEAMADGLPVDAAVAQARESISLALPNTVEWGTPVLYMRTPDGVLLNLTEKPLVQEASPPVPEVTVEPLKPKIALPEQASPLRNVAPTAAENTSPTPGRAAKRRAAKRKGTTRKTIQPKTKPSIKKDRNRDVQQLTVRCERTLTGHTKEVLGITFSPDGKMLASASGGNVFPGHMPLRLWRVTDGEFLRSFEGHTNGVTSVAFSPDGETLVSGSHDCTVRLWRVADGGFLRSFEGHAYSVRSVAFSPDGTIIASGADDKIIRLWRVADGKLLHTLEDHTRWVRNVAFSPNGETVVSVSGGTVFSGQMPLLLWRVADGELLRSFEGHTHGVTSVAFSPDGAIIASGAEDKTVRLWRVVDGELLHRLEEHTDVISSLAFSPDGTMLASGSFDKTIRLWKME